MIPSMLSLRVVFRFSAIFFSLPSDAYSIRLPKLQGHENLVGKWVQNTEGRGMMHCFDVATEHLPEEAVRAASTQRHAWPDPTSHSLN